MSEEQNNEKGETVPILFTMGKILHYLSISTGFTPLKKIHQVLGIPRSTASRILFSLYQLNYLEKDTQKPAYRLRYGSLICHSIVQQHRKLLQEASQNPLEQLAQELGETVKLSIWNEESQDVESLCTAVGNSKMHIQVPIGIHFPKHAGAASKILLALNEKSLAEVQKWQEPLLAYTPNTITDIPTLQRKLEQVRQEGWAYDEQEYQEGIEALACAIFVGSSLLAALSIPYIANSAIRERIYAQKERIWQCARQIGSAYQALL